MENELITIEDFEKIRDIINRIYSYIGKAENSLSRARLFCIFDFFENTSLIKYIKYYFINSSKTYISTINLLLSDLQREIKGKSFSVNLDIGFIVSYLDFFNNKFLPNLYVKSQLDSALTKIKSLGGSLRNIENKLSEKTKNN